jgi:glycosyltransferase involved in cell wall biosynthesis
MENLFASASEWSATKSTVVVAEARQISPAITLPISIVIPARNEAHNLPACLESVRGAGEIYVIDSQSTDCTAEIAQSFGAQTVQFHYQGGWPKKRQWALDKLPLRYDWILLLDADESLTPELISEINQAIFNPEIDGYHVGLRMHFLGRHLRHSDATFYKLCLFRRGKGRFECRTRQQDMSMGDMEVHEHVIVEGRTGKLNSQLIHRNIDSLASYIRKHNEYSNWEARVLSQSESPKNELKPNLFGSQAERRRWIRKKFFRVPGSPVLFFLYKYFLRLGFLDGAPGLIYCLFQGIQFFHIKAKLYEAKLASEARISPASRELPTLEVSNVRH